jgi:hypothetical protein
MAKPRLKPNNLSIALKEKAKGSEVKRVETARTERPTRKETTREGRVMVSGWLPIEARSSFRLIQAKHPEKLMQDLIVEAVNDLFAKYNVPQTAATPGFSRPLNEPKA